MALREIFEDADGSLSATRIAAVAVTAVVLVVWVIVAVGSHTLPDLPSGVQVFIGTMWTAKAVQKFGERKP